MEKPISPIGILGGTFDPIHLGHIDLATKVMQHIPLQEIRFIPCNQPVHKAEVFAPAKDRLAMLNIALADTPGIIVDDRELIRDTPSYMLYTLQSLKNDHPNHPLCLIVGMDAFVDFNSWFKWQELFYLCHLIVVEREKFAETLDDELQEEVNKRKTISVDELSEKLSGLIYFYDEAPINVSATEIRGLFAKGIRPENMLNDAVYAYIKAQHLYGT